MGKDCCNIPGTAHSAGSLAEIAQLVNVIGKKLTRITRQNIKGTELTPAQYSVLMMLGEEDARPFSALATACCCSRSTITGIVDTMEKKGLVERATNPDDRRSTLVVLSVAGDELQRAIPSKDKILTDCCANITPEEQQQLTELLRKLNNALA